jgi:hypothetical protein
MSLILVALNLTAFVFLLQINVGIFPLFPSSFTRDRSEKVNTLVSDLSQGVIVSTFFYFLLVRIPEGAKAKRIRALILPKALTIASQIEISIRYIVEQYGLKVEDIDEIQRGDLSKITGFNGIPMNFKYQVIAQDGRLVPFGTGTATDIEHFESERVLVARLVDEILTLPHIIDENNDFVDLLPRLRDCSFYGSVRTYSQYGLRVSVPDFSSNLYDYWVLYIRLRRAIGSGPSIRAVKNTM